MGTDTQNYTPIPQEPGAASIQVTRPLFFLNAAIWLLFGIVSLIRMARGPADHPITFLLTFTDEFGLFYLITLLIDLALLLLVILNRSAFWIAPTQEIT